MGFCIHKKGLIEFLGVDLDARGNVKTDKNMMTSKEKLLFMWRYESWSILGS